LAAPGANARESVDLAQCQLVLVLDYHAHIVTAPEINPLIVDEPSSPSASTISPRTRKSGLGSQRRCCLRLIEVSAEDEKEASWRESVDSSDDCVNKFPVAYGSRLLGRHQPDTKEITAKPLRRGIVYEVITTSGATGYGSGRFIVHANGKVENLPLKSNPS
jgi:hypothetical protein